jgi:hypothetical protein
MKNRTWCIDVCAMQLDAPCAVIGWVMAADDLHPIATQIAAMLGETAVAPRRQIERIVALLGSTRALDLAEEALAREAAGGMLVPDGSRCRTPGGVFFQLVKQQVTRRQHWLLFRRPPRPQQHATTSALLTWATRRAAVVETFAQKGALDDVKITLVGRPGAVVVRPNCVLTTMTSSRGPSLPRGLPTPPPTPTPYMVYIAPKHWARVADALVNPDDALIVEGWAVFDPELEGIAVFATFVTTKRIKADQKG